MASTAELEAEILADLEENPDVYTAPVNDVITIDPETKTINLPSSEVLFGTEEEQGIERKYFKCPRIVGDNIDLFTHQIYISYMAVKDKNATFIPNSIPQSYWCDDVALDETGNYITFSWLLSGNVLASRGFVGFAVIAKSVEGDILKTRWKTAPAVGTVLMTLPDAGEGISELYPDIITQLLDRMGAMEEIATEEAVQNYVEAYLVENPPSGMTAEEKEQLQKNTEDISSLSEEIANIPGGADGKSAYQYAQDGGYAGTETEFAEKLAQEQLTGTTNELTPTQVYDAVSAGIPVKVQYIDSTYGLLSFTAFNVAESLSVIASQTIVYYNGVCILAELNGDKTDNTWGFMTTTLAQKADIPTDDHINSLINTKLGVIENGAY